MNSSFKSPDTANINEDPLTILANVSSQHQFSNAEVAADTHGPFPLSELTSSENSFESNEKSVETILSTLSSDKPYVCAICLKGYDNPTQLQRHELVHTGKKPFKCDVCLKEFGTKAGLDYHSDTHKTPNVFCDVCKKGFVSEKRLEEHTKCHVEDKNYICEVCGRGFKASQGLQAHLKLHTGNLRFACDMCDKKFPGRNALDAHRRTHTGEKPFACDICDMSFRTKGTLAGHYMTHQEKTPYKCNVCHRGFKRKDGLDGHMKSHEPPGNFPCDECGNVYSRLIGLKAHKRTHVKPTAVHTCEYCGKTFSRKDNLGIHKRIHTNDLRHQCSVCGRMFTHKCRLDKHSKEAHGQMHDEQISDASKPKSKKRNKTASKIAGSKSTDLCQNKPQTTPEIVYSVSVSNEMATMQPQVVDSQVISTYTSLQTSGWLQYPQSLEPTPYQPSYHYAAEMFDTNSYSPQLISQQAGGGQEGMLNLTEHAESIASSANTCRGDTMTTTANGSILTILSSQNQPLLPESSIGGCTTVQNENLTSLHNDGLRIATVPINMMRDQYHYDTVAPSGLPTQQAALQYPLPFHGIVTPAPIPSLAGGTVQPLSTVLEKTKIENLSIAPLSSLAPNFSLPVTSFPQIDTQHQSDLFSMQHHEQPILLGSNVKTSLPVSNDGDPLTSLSSNQKTLQQVSTTIPVSTEFNHASKTESSDQIASPHEFQIEQPPNEKQGRTHSCPECNLTFKTSSQLVMHDRVHRATFRPFKCDLCDKQFRSKGALRTHWKTLHASDIRTLACDKCNKKFKSKRHLKEHQWCHLPAEAKKIPCEFCTSTFKVQSYLKRHIKRCHGTSTVESLADRHIKCKHCGASFSSDELKVHLKSCESSKKHIIDNEKKIPENLGNDKMRPSINDMTLETTDRFDVDTNSSESSNPELKLTPCLVKQTQVLNSTASLNGNSVKEGLKEMTDEEDTGLHEISDEAKSSDFPSSTVKGKTASAYSIASEGEHFQDRKQRNKIDVNMCKMFSKLDKEPHHQGIVDTDWVARSVTNEEQKKKIKSNDPGLDGNSVKKQLTAPCSLCGRTYSSKSKLRLHMRILHKLRNYFQCKECTAIFSSRFELRDHLAKHTTKKKYKCVVCNVSFKFLANLHRHISYMHKIPSGTDIFYDAKRKKAATVTGCKQINTRAGMKTALLTTESGTAEKVITFLQDRTIPRKNYFCATPKLVSNITNLELKLMSCGVGGNSWRKHNHCWECKLSFKNAKRLCIHKKIVHPSKFSIKTIVCGKCGLTFHGRYQIMQHICQHSKVKKRLMQVRKKLPAAVKNPIAQEFTNIRPLGDKDPAKDTVTRKFIDKGADKPFQCPKCQIVFKTSYRLKCHIQAVHTQERNFKCDKCPKSFKIKRHLMEHLSTHQPMDGSVFCSVCKATFLAPHLLQRHIRRSHGEKKFTCPNLGCGRTFSEKGQLNQHLKTAKHILCQKGSATKNRFGAKHATPKKASTKQMLVCRFCGKESVNKTNLDNHEQTHLPPAFFCNICGQGFRVQHYLKRHLKRHREVHCHLCKSKFNMWKDLRSHMIMMHGTDIRKPASEELNEGASGPSKSGLRTNNTTDNLVEDNQKNCLKFVCEVCGVYFKKRSGMQAHLLRHKGERPYQCDICGAAFRTRSVLRGHRVQHTGKFKYFCATCGKGCLSKSRFEAHKRTHTGERPFICTVCGLRFTTKGILLGHHATHVDVLPYSCDLCGRKFKRKDGLRGHLKSHKAPGTFPCNICGKVFTREHGMKNHQRSHTNPTVFHQCQVCKKNFSRKDNLRIHMKRHSNQLPFICHHCDKTFSHKCRLDKHTRCSHGQTETNLPALSSTTVVPVKHVPHAH